MPHPRVEAHDELAAKSLTMAMVTLWAITIVAEDKSITHKTFRGICAQRLPQTVFVTTIRVTEAGEQLLTLTPES